MTKTIALRVNENFRAQCACGENLPTRPLRGNWGDWHCKCGLIYCQDCGEVVNANTMECMAYEEFMHQLTKDD